MRRLVCWGAAMLLAGATQGYAQKAIGSVSTADATVSNSGAGVVEVNAGRAVLRGNGTVTAKDHTAVVALQRGGEVHVCQRSGLHVSEAPQDALLFGLDRGALEIRTKAKTGDVVMTPDLRFTMAEAGPLELEMRVSMNGDTCVDNHGRKAPTLKITDAFGEANYELKPGQHVTFEHGSLREVVDKETVPCGCPPDEKEEQKRVSLAEAAIAGGAAAGKPVTPELAAAAHPFPEAESAGLAPVTPPAPEATGVTHVQVATTLAYDPTAPKAVEPGDPAPALSPVQAAVAEPIPEKKPSGGPFGAVGRFFKRLFAR